jgi:glycerol kinase
MHKYILAIDQGTTSSRAILFNAEGAIVQVAQKEFTQIFPQAGWVEHNAIEIWETQLEVCKQVLINAQATTADVAAIGITNQRETTVVWNKNTGLPICNAIVWQDRRTSEYCNQLKEKNYSAIIQQKTGLVIDAYFSGTKINWILENVPEAKNLAAENALAFGTIDSWLLYKLTEGKVHATDVSNASRTMLCNINTLQWDDELCTIIGVPKNILPTIVESSSVYGHTTLLGGNIAIASMIGDQQSALFGQMCVSPGMIKNTYGTGCFMLMNTGEKIVASKHNLLTTVAWKINGVTHYALEGSVFIAGAVVQWLRDSLQIIKTAAEVEALATSVPNTDGVYVVPAFVGLGAPYWNQEARGNISGLTRGSTLAHIARASVESIAYQVADVLLAMKADSNIDFAELRVDGGATANNFLMQFQSNIIQATVTKPTITETSALGAAYLAGLAVGFFKDVESLKMHWAKEANFTPKITIEEKDSLYKGWLQAVKGTVAITEN